MTAVSQTQSNGRKPRPRIASPVFDESSRVDDYDSHPAWCGHKCKDPMYCGHECCRVSKEKRIAHWDDRKRREERFRQDEKDLAIITESALNAYVAASSPSLPEWIQNWLERPLQYRAYRRALEDKPAKFLRDYDFIALISSSLKPFNVALARAPSDEAKEAIAKRAAAPVVAFGKHDQVIRRQRLAALHEETGSQVVCLTEEELLKDLVEEDDDVDGAGDDDDVDF
jgi:hypothetical protein